MGIITVEKKERLFWLGRYIERAYTSLKDYIKSYDRMIDSETDYYKEVCEKTGFPGDFRSGGEFVYSYAYDSSNPFSIISSINHAFDNAIILRDEIGTDTLAYIHMAIDSMEAASRSTSPIFDLQKVLDNILAFWGCLDDETATENTRNITKSGKRYERLDMHIRLKYPIEDLRTQLDRFEYVLIRSTLTYKKAPLKHLDAMLEEDEINYKELLIMAEKIF